jgi:DNA-binding PadR family transcriptional regulator
MHPYEVAQTLRSRHKHESVRLNYGSLYSVVDSLERRGLIAAREPEREGRRPERTVYELTDAGGLEIIHWLSDLVAAPVKEYLQFEAALSFLPALPPDDVVSLLHERADALDVQVAAMRAARQVAADHGVARLFLLEDEYQQRLLEAELDWVRLLVKDIEGGALDGLEQWRGWFAEGTPDQPGRR